ncbi:MAG: carbohydrate ABC transporter permease [Chloroflexi bacterium OHK40]
MVSTARTPGGARLARLGRGLLSHILLITVAALFALPFLWLLITSLKTRNQVFTDPLIWVPHPVMWSNYVEAVTAPGFPYLRLLGNTVFYTTMSTIGMVLSSTVVAYAFARMAFRGRDTLFGLTIATMLLPSVVLLIPTYVLFRTLGWVGSYLPLIAPMWLGGAFNIFLLRQFMLGIPNDLTDAARVDGAGDLTILWRVVVPLTRSAIIVVALLHFLWTWNDFMGPLIYLDEAAEAPLVLGLYTFRGTFGGQPEWHLMMAATMLAIAPIIVLFFFTQRYFIEGMTFTGLKGA